METMHDSPIWHVGNLAIDLSTFGMIIVTILIVFLIARLAVRNLSVENPSKLQNFMEWVVEFVQGVVASTMPLSKGKPYIMLGITLILFIFVANLLGLPFAIVTDHHGSLELFGYQIGEDKEHNEFLWWKSPTADLSVTFGLGLITFLIVNYLGITRNTKHYFKHYIEPYPVFLPLNLLKEVSKPVTLALRLYANIFAGEILIATIAMAGFFGIPLMIAWQGFSIFVGALQAFLFTILTMVYIAQSTIHEDH